MSGLIQLGCTTLPFPESARGIPVKGFCRRLHFLHAAIRGADEGAVIGRFTITIGTVRAREGLSFMEWMSASLVRLFSLHELPSRSRRREEAEQTVGGSIRLLTSAATIEGSFPHRASVGGDPTSP